jgi:hypothetical protein
MYDSVLVITPWISAYDLEIENRVEISRKSTRPVESSQILFQFVLRPRVRLRAL